MCCGEFGVHVSGYTLDSREQIVGLLLLRVRGRIDVEGQFVGSGIPASARVPDEGTEVEEQGLEAMDPRSVFESLGVDLLKCLLGARSRGHGVTRVLGFRHNTGGCATPRSCATDFGALENSTTSAPEE